MKPGILTILITAAVLLLQMNSYAQKSTSLKIYDVLEKLVNDRSARENDFVKVLGYFNRNDGGAAEYYIKKNVIADSSEHVVKLSNGLSAVLLTPLSVNYKMFGAKGDGTNNDAEQIAMAHEYANKRNIPVVNNSGEFWLKSPIPIVIQTSVNWGETIFHIDESYNAPSKPRFRVSSKYKTKNIELSAADKSLLLSSIKPGVSQIPILADYKNCLIIIADAKDRIGYRAGEQYNGQSWAREDFFYVEEYGRVIGDVAWTFKDYTKLVAVPVDENYLEISGGVFYLSGNNPTTKDGNYLQNGFSITRSRTIISNQWVGLEPGKKDTSTRNPRSGFYSFSSVYDVRLENVRLIPYEQNRGSASTMVTSGTYGISMGRVMNCHFNNVTAEGTKVHWGVFGSNLVKNFVVENSRLNRVDVHFHCWNLRISNSEIGFKGITVTGGGKLIIENSSCAGSSFIGFRSDFGSRWDGDIKITNCTFKVSSEAKTVNVLAFSPRNFDYKYPVGFGRTISIENFIIDFGGVTDKNATCWMMRFPSFAKIKTGHRFFLPETLRLENIKVVGREKGVRITEIADAGSYQLNNAGEYSSFGLSSNASFIFSNVQLENLNKEPESAVHFALTGAAYVDNYGLHPSIKFNDCKNIVLKNSEAVSDMYFDNCSISALQADEKKPLRGRMIFTRTTFLPVLKNDDKNIYQLNSEQGTSFTDCIVYAPQFNGQSRPELLGKTGFIEFNRKVRFNHSNTILGKNIIDYYNTKGTSPNPKFISMLKSHYQLEPELVQ